MAKSPKPAKLAKPLTFDEHYPLVLYLAKRFKGRGIDYEDLVQVGSMGLMSALQSFDPKRGYRFSTYAYIAISRRMKTAILKDSKAVYIPPTTFTNAKQAGYWTAKRMRLARESRTVDIDQPYFRAALPARGSDAEPESAADVLVVQRVLGLLCKRDASVLRMRYLENATLKQIGKVHGISKERARQLIKGALNQARTLLK